MDSGIHKIPFGKTGEMGSSSTFWAAPPSHDSLSIQKFKSLHLELYYIYQKFDFMAIL
jgi:hypothetical protein